LTGFSLIHSAYDEQRRVFVGSSALTLNDKSLWVRHTLHCFHASLRLLHLEPDLIEFLDVNDELDVDVIQEINRSISKFKINSRNLKSEYVHRVSPPCQGFEEYQQQEQKRTNDSSPDEACDCAAKRLFRLIVTEAKREEDSESIYWWEARQSSLLYGMPRDVNIKYKPAATNEMMPGVLSWDVSQTERLLKGFEVFLSRGELPASLLFNKIRYEGGVLQSDEGCENYNDSGQGMTIVSVNGSEKHVTLSLLSPGVRYIASVRQKGSTAFYSVPFAFTAPLHPPSNVQVNTTPEVINIHWDYPHDSTGLSFKITAYSPNDTELYAIGNIQMLSHSIQMEAMCLLEISSVSVHAVRDDEVTSEESRLSLDGIVHETIVQNAQKYGDNSPNQVTSYKTYK
jgi:hypothetical protein